MPQDLIGRDLIAAGTRRWSPRRLHALDDVQIDALADVLIDCVEGGTPVSFMHPLSRHRAVTFWRQVARDVAAGERARLVRVAKGWGSDSSRLLLFSLF